MPRQERGGSLANYRIFETDEYIKKFSKLPTSNAPSIQKKLHSYVYPQLIENPFYGKNIKKLRDYDPETWRYRIGKYRLFYLIDEDEKIIYLLTIDLRKDAY